MKNKTQRRIYKISSKRFQLNKWDLTLSKDNTLPEEIVKIGDNQILEFIRQIKNVLLEDEENLISELKSNIKNKVDVSININELNKITFVNELCFVIIDKISDYHKLNKFMVLNGIKYKRLFATAGGVKSATIIYVIESMHDELQRRIDNDRNLDIEFSAGKLEAYKSLSFTNSVKVQSPRKIIIVKDAYNSIIEKKVIELDDSNTKYPTMEIKDNFGIKNNVSDGFMVISMEYAEKLSVELNLDYIPSGFLFRNSFLKAMGYPMEIIKFAEEIVGKNTITDIYGVTHCIDMVDMIIPESVLKLWQSYDSSDDYLEKCEKNGYSFRVAKVTPKDLDNRRNLNYQFIQTLQMSDDDISELCEYTVNTIKDIMNEDYIKTILFTKGNGLTNNNIDLGELDYTKALMIDEKMLQDPFVKTKVHNMIRKKINDAKIGVISTEGNFQIISGDIFYFLENCFGVEKPKGLLKYGEIYSKYWSDKKVGEVALFRAPMSSHNNIRKAKVVDNDCVNKWYGHLNNIMILNSYDTITTALNGADYDADAFFSTNNNIILKNIKELPCVICKQKTAPKKICEFDDFIKANVNGFGDEIGSITNKITSMISKQVTFKEGTKEFVELEYRILCGQLYQQNAIDKIKSIESNPMPKEWCDFKANIIERNEDNSIAKLDDFNLSILADKKPYFFIYNYQSLKKEYMTYMKNVNTKSLNLFGITIEELIVTDHKSKDMEDFILQFNNKMVVDTSPSVMNRLCWHMEKELNEIKYQTQEVFNYSILKTNKEYNQRDLKRVEKIYNNYKSETSAYTVRQKESHSSSDTYSSDRDSFKLNFIKKLSELNIDDEDLGNIVIDMCYKSNNSKQFAWDVVGQQLIRNLLINNKHIITFPIQDDYGDIEFNGKKFSIVKKKVGDSFCK